MRIDKHETSKQNPWKQRCLPHKQDETFMQQLEAERKEIYLNWTSSLKPRNWGNNE